MLSTSLFNYELPDELIARYPAEHRDGSRMLALNRKTGETELHQFPDIVNFLKPGDALICNNTKVLQGRMYARKNGIDSGALFEILLLEPVDGNPQIWNVMIKPGKRAKDGVIAQLIPNAGGEINSKGDNFTIEGRNRDDSFRIIFNTPDIERLQRDYGHIPLPPYLHREAEESDSERYQTVYAQTPGAVAAPTAGLHFTPEILNLIKERNIGYGELTLHVGAGTFKPVSVDNAEDHHMHFEEYVLPEATAELINSTRRSGGRVLAIGTTTVRVLESCADESGFVHPRHDRTNIFLYPPYRPRAVDMLLTNFHLPCSTLLMLVSCFCDRERVLAAYETAKKERMRFYSYGDCMLLY